MDDWELIHDSEDAGSVKSSDSVESMRGLEGIEGESEGMIRTDYFSLDSQGKYSKVVASEEGSVESDNPSWIDPGSETRSPRKEPGEFWPDSGSDRSDDRKFSEFDGKNDLGFAENAKSQVGFEGAGEIGSEGGDLVKLWSDSGRIGPISMGFDAKKELGFAKNAKSQVDFEGDGGIGAEGKDLVKFWSDSGRIGPISMDFGDKTEMGIGGNANSNDGSDLSAGEKVGDSSSAGDGVSSGNESVVVGEVKSGGGEEKRCVVWWKLPFEFLKYCAFRASPAWTFSVAAAVMGFVILGRRLYKMKRKSQSLQLKVTMDDKKVSQFMSRAARLNEAFSVVKRVPVIRPSLPAVGVTPWPMMSLR
ncbi:hypothetical protein CEY00_Acc11420 [Actinidia chinensis var. chinensis]|uniref:DUF6821 domain-containing protein n=1 Tax=Actinidia chinensis var. chinensis TaxID=1590841 RepID=A0A2R6R2A1_ACTCC|nr:hypothetical protein CEY00_Acc11420 [Actinidia chinensis var. chinensis]